MRLQTKLIVRLVPVVFIAVVAGQGWQFYTQRTAMNELSQQESEVLRQSVIDSADNLFESMCRASSGSLERGEMDKFSRDLAAQQQLDGVMDFSLYDTSGVISHSSNPALLGEKLPPDLQQKLLANLEPVQRVTQNAIEIYAPQHVTGDCVRCHRDWIDAKVGGVLALRYSTAALNQSEALALQTADKSQAASLRTFIVAGVSVVAVLALGVWFSISRGVSNPLQRTMRFAENIANGDLTQQLDINQSDEIGLLTKTLNGMAGSLRKTMRDIAANAQTLARSASGLSETATQLADGAEQTNNQSASVSTASEEMSGNMNNMAASTEQMSANVKTVASAVEEMTASIGEIAVNAEQAATVAEQAAGLAHASNDNIGQLGSAATAIGKVIETIQDIAEQTNLLALNAAIEAARAGDAGRGFAVVANEVKELAKQTAAATEDIRRRIEGIQGSTGSAITSISEISDVIGKVNEVSRAIASAVEEQSITTKEIAQNVAQTAAATEVVSHGVGESASASEEIKRTIANVSDVAQKAAQGASQTLAESQELSRMGEQLQALVGQFKT